MEDSLIIDKISDPATRDYGFNLLAKSYADRIYWHIRKMVVDHEDTNDLVQDVFIKIWKNIGSFRGESKLYTWIYRIATNETLTFLEKKKRRFFLPIHDVEKELAGKIDRGDMIDGSVVQLNLQRALLTLPPKQRIVFNLKYFENMRFDDISEVTGTSVGALKASYHHAVKKIEKYIEDN